MGREKHILKSSSGVDLVISSGVDSESFSAIFNQIANNQAIQKRIEKRHVGAKRVDLLLAQNNGYYFLAETTPCDSNGRHIYYAEFTGDCRLRNCVYGGRIRIQDK